MEPIVVMAKLMHKHVKQHECARLRFGKPAHHSEEQ
jgi:hypothetical protein